ncbi:L,D-transpeptidase, partial [Pseudoscardovia radai]
AKVGWQQEGSSWRYLEKSDKPIWRLYNPNGGVHHYTTDQNEYDQLAKVGWLQEGVAGYAADESFGVAVHRLYNPNDTTGAHHFTLDENEVN